MEENAAVCFPNQAARNLLNTISGATPTFTPSEMRAITGVRLVLNGMLRDGMPTALFEQVNKADQALLEALSIHWEAKRLS